MIWDVQHTHHQRIMLSDCVVSVSSHHTQQVSIQAPRYACFRCCYAHLSAVLGLGRYAVITVHISHKVYLHHQMHQGFMSWAEQQISSSANGV